MAVVRGKPSGPALAAIEAAISGFAVPVAHLRYPIRRRSALGLDRTLAPAGAALLFGAALFVAVFAPKAGSTGARSHVTQPALVKIVGSEELPTAAHADASPAATSSSEPSEPSPTELATPTSVVPPATPFPPVVAVKIADSGPGVSQSLRTMSAAPEATAAPSATQASVAAPPDAPQRPAELVPTVERKVLTGAQPPTPNLDRPTKLSRKTPVRVTVAKTAATAPSATPEARACSCSVPESR
jgi:hypothetical protein